jgi:long-chain acyl-CoA synthetase
VLSQIEEHQGTVLYGVPTQLKLIAQNAGDRIFGSVRWVRSSGARWFSEIAPLLKKIFPNAEIAEFYGASELSFVSLAFHNSDPRLPQGSVGRPFYGTEIRIGSVHEPGLTEGRIWVHSAGLFDGYLGQAPDDFSEAIDAQGRRWLSVGDLGRMDDQGYLFLAGRESRRIVSSGKNLYPEETEAFLLAYPGVAEAAVIGLPDALRGERLIGLLKLAHGTHSFEAFAATLMAYLRPLVDDFKIPREYHQMHDWPRTATGKTDFQRLKDMAAALKKEQEALG